jgi:23S rRNA (cytosine1962-C5)-methyltransferase
LNPPLVLPPLPAPPSKVLKLRADRQLCDVIRRGHIWVYRRSATAVAGESASLVTIYDDRNRFLAVGLNEPQGAIAVRVLHVGKPCPIDASFFGARIDKALQLRAPLVESSTNGYRIIHGENDGLPGLVLDRYDATLVLKLYTTSWVPYLPVFLHAVSERVSFERIVLRLPRTVVRQVETLHGLQDGQLLAGESPAGPVMFRENGLHFEADVLTGQKTGFFLDQRENRERVRDRARGCTVLNICSHSGGFSVYSAAGGARSVADLDISGAALQSARRNFAHNPALAGVQHEALKGNAFDLLTELAQAGRKFDLVVLDPPSFAMREADKEAALNAYRTLNRRAAALVRAGGQFVSCSCSAHVTPEEFRKAVQAGLAGRNYRIQEETAHALDHPVGFPEGRYLKGLFVTITS